MKLAISTIGTIGMLASGAISQYFIDSIAKGSKWSVAFWVLIAVALALFFEFITARFRTKAPQPGPILTALDIKQRPQKILVLTLSTFTSDPPRRSNNEKFEEYFLLYAQSPRWNGWPLFAAIRPHLQTLEHLVLIGTYGPKGSVRQIEAQIKLLREMLSDRVKFYFAAVVAGQIKIIEEDFLNSVRNDGIRADSVTELRACYRKCLEFSAGHDISDSEVCFDITAGPRLIPMAAIAATINKTCTFTLVDTNLLAAGDPQPVSMWDLQVPTELSS